MNLYTKILAILGDGELTGGRIIELAQGTVAPRLHQGNVYPALRSLVAKGVVSVREVHDADGLRGGRPRFYYRRVIKSQGQA